MTTITTCPVCHLGDEYNHNAGTCGNCGCDQLVGLPRQEPAQFEVSAEWMKACGKGDQAKAFPVIRTYDRRLIAFADLDVGNGQVWTVITEWRGRFI